MRVAGRAIAAAGVLAAIVFACPAAAKTYVVTRLGDPTPNGCHAHNCSLREAIRAANAHAGGDEVVLPKAKTYNLRIENTNPAGEGEALEGDLDVTGPLHLVHPGKGKARVDANGIDRVLQAFTGAPMKVVRVVLSGGDDNNGGGGIRAGEDDLTLNRAAVVGNAAPNINGGGGIELVGKADLRLIRSTVARNRTQGDGGGIDGNDGIIVIKRSKIVSNRAAMEAGGVHFFSESTTPSRVVKSTIARNGSEDQGAGFLVSSGKVSVKDSTISGNETPVSGGGIAVVQSKLSAVNSTIAANRAGGGGGGILIDVGGDAAVNAITVARNHADESGGGILYIPNSIGFDIRNSLVALNTAASIGPDCAGEEFESHGHNVLSSDDGCLGFDAPGDIVRADPRIGTLGDHGGPTKTIPLKRHSPAIGHAKRATSPRRDQRGHKRDRHPDSGAFER